MPLWVPGGPLGSPCRGWGWQKAGTNGSCFRSTFSTRFLARSCGAPGRPGWPLVGLLGFPVGPLVVPVGPLGPLDPLPSLLKHVIQAHSTLSDFLNIQNQPAGNTEFFSQKIEEHDKQSALKVPLCRILLPFIQGHFYPGKTGVCKPWATWSFC